MFVGTWGEKVKMKEAILLVIYIVIFKFVINNLQKKLSEKDNLIMFARSPNQLLIAWISSILLMCVIIWLSVSEIELVTGLLLVLCITLLLNSLLSFEGYSNDQIIVYRLLQNKKQILNYADIQNVILRIRKQRIHHSLSYKIVFNNGSKLIIGTQFAPFSLNDLEQVDDIISKYSECRVEQRYPQSEVDKLCGDFGELLRKKLDKSREE